MIELASISMSGADQAMIKIDEQHEHLRTPKFRLAAVYSTQSEIDKALGTIEAKTATLGSRLEAFETGEREILAQLQELRDLPSVLNELAASIDALRAECDGVKEALAQL